MTKSCNVNETKVDFQPLAVGSTDVGLRKKINGLRD